MKKSKESKKSICGGSPHEKDEFLFPTREQFLESCKTQKFSLPMPVIEYIIMNPASPAVYQKLIQSCKWFFIRNPILVVDNVNISSATKWGSCKKERCFDCVHIDVGACQNKIWLAKKLRLSAYNKPDYISTVIQRSLIYNVQSLELHFINITCDELKFLSNGVKIVSIQRSVNVRNSKGQIASVEDVVGIFRGCDEFRMSYPAIQPENVCHSYKDLADCCGTIKKVVLDEMPSTFNTLRFYDSLYDAENRSIIAVFGYDIDQSINEKIYETPEEDFGFVPPYIDLVENRTSFALYENFQRMVREKLN